MEIRKKFFALALENGFDFSNSLFAASGGAGRRLRVRQAEPGARKVPSHGVLRSFVSNLLFGGLGYEDLRLCSAVAFDHRLRSPVRSP
jgi:hypothetical protein